MNLKHFMGKDQLAVLKSHCRGEEGEFFKGMIDELKNTIAGMPASYETDGQGDQAIVTLHYFKGGSDWWILERDGEIEQMQAFGYVCLNGDTQNAELGYICIEELIQYGVELDLYWVPKTLKEIKTKLYRK